MYIGRIIFAFIFIVYPWLYVIISIPLHFIKYGSFAGYFTQTIFKLDDDSPNVLAVVVSFWSVCCVISWIISGLGILLTGPLW